VIERAVDRVVLQELSDQVWVGEVVDRHPAVGLDWGCQSKRGLHVARVLSDQTISEVATELGTPKSISGIPDTLVSHG
jgi:hypothetical protein